MISEDTVLALKDGSSFRGLGETGLMLRLEGGQLYTLNETGAAFVRHIDGTRPFGTLLDAVTQEFEVPDRSELAADMSALVEDLEREGLIVRR